jgi:hypothetical protein
MITKKQAEKFLYEWYIDDDLIWSNLCWGLARQIAPYFREYWRKNNHEGRLYCWQDCEMDYDDIRFNIEYKETIRLCVALQFIEDNYED